MMIQQTGSLVESGSHCWCADDGRAAVIAPVGRHFQLRGVVIGEELN